MPDEAITHVFSLHNQLVEGHQWLWEKLGIEVENSWSIDPFGCSSAMAYLLAASGIKSLVIQRVHYSWKEFLSVAGSLDVVWEQDFQGPKIKLRVQQSPGYSVTDSCGPATSLCADYDFNMKISDAEHITFHNVHKKSEVLLGQYGRIGSLTESNVVLVTLGGDFRFNNESEWLQQYRNYKAIFDYINGNEHIYRAKLAFGTLKDFFQQVYDTNVTLKGDFFPYADLYSDNTLAYWTGFYSTRPYWKKLSRTVESMLRSTEILYTLTLNLVRQLSAPDRHQVAILSNLYKKIVRGRRSVALFQHHDGITGTAKARVMKDYKDKLTSSLNELKFTLKTCVEIINKVNCQNSTQTQSDLKKKMVVFNSLPYYKTDVIGIKTDYPSLIVTDSKGIEIDYQVKCLSVTALAKENVGIPSENFELVFIVELPPLSLKYFEIRCTEAEYNTSDYIKNFDSPENRAGGLTVVNSNQKVTFGENGLVTRIIKEFGEIHMAMNLKAYTSDEGHSGAYLFKPMPEQINLYSHTPQGNIVFSDGSIYKEVTVVYEEDYEVSSRIYGTSSYLNQVVEIKITYNISECNTELFLEFVTGLCGTKFFTDVNGFQMRERVRQTSQPVESKYFPMTSMAVLQNSENVFALLSDHSHGVASPMDGSIEVMLDRRISGDDKRGLEEGIEDRLKTTSTFYIVFGQNTPDTIQLLDILGLQLNNPSNILSINELSTSDMHFLNKPLPYNIHLLNLRTISANNFPSRTALLSLHNVGYFCASGCTFPSESNFNYLDIKKIIKTNLTGIKEQEELDELSEIQVKPFNIQSVKIYF